MIVIFAATLLSVPVAVIAAVAVSVHDTLEWKRFKDEYGIE